jgi:hypothetical protein
MRKDRMFVCSIAILIFGLFLVPTAQSARVHVNCNGPSASMRTIQSALAHLPPVGPNTVLVSGTCVEKLSIRGFDRLTIQGNPSATIDGGDDPNADTLDIFESHEVTLKDITISGGGLTVQCALQSLCRFHHVTIQNSLGLGNNRHQRIIRIPGFGHD